MRTLFILVLILFYCPAFAQFYFGPNILSNLFSENKYDRFGGGIQLEYRFPKTKTITDGHYYISTEYRLSGTVDSYRLNLTSGLTSELQPKGTYLRLGAGLMKNWDELYNGYGFLGEMGLMINFKNSTGGINLLNRYSGLFYNNNRQILKESFLVIGLHMNVKGIKSIFSKEYSTSP